MRRRAPIQYASINYGDSLFGEPLTLLSESYTYSFLITEHRRYVSHISDSFIFSGQ